MARGRIRPRKAARAIRWIARERELRSLRRRPGHPRPRGIGRGADASARAARERVELRGETLLVVERDESREEVRVESPGEGVPRPVRIDGLNRRILRERRHGVREHLGHVPAKALPAAGLASFTTAIRPSRETKTSGLPARPLAIPGAASTEKRLEQRLLCSGSATRFSGCHCTAGGAAGGAASNAPDEVVRRRRYGTRPGAQILSRPGGASSRTCLSAATAAAKREGEGAGRARTTCARDGPFGRADSRPTS